jgi:hypothetical protein
MTEKQESVMMSRIVDSIEEILRRNISVKCEMTERLSAIYPPSIEEPSIKDDDVRESPRYYCQKIAILLSMLEEVTSGHEENLRHLRQIV